MKREKELRGSDRDLNRPSDASIVTRPLLERRVHLRERECDKVERDRGEGAEGDHV